MLNELRDECHKNAVEHGFWEVTGDDGLVIKDGEEKNTFAKCMALVVEEIGEAVTADRKGGWLSDIIAFNGGSIGKEDLSQIISDFNLEGKKDVFDRNIKGTVEEELADIIIRIMDMAGHYNIDLDSIVRLKMDYNASRPYKHGKEY